MRLYVIIEQEGAQVDMFLEIFIKVSDMPGVYKWVITSAMHDVENLLLVAIESMGVGDFDGTLRLEFAYFEQTYNRRGQSEVVNSRTRMHLILSDNAGRPISVMDISHIKPDDEKGNPFLSMDGENPSHSKEVFRNFLKHALPTAAV